MADESGHECRRFRLVDRLRNAVPHNANEEAQATTNEERLVDVYALLDELKEDVKRRKAIMSRTTKEKHPNYFKDAENANREAKKFRQAVGKAERQNKPLTDRQVKELVERGSRSTSQNRSETTTRVKPINVHFNTVNWDQPATRVDSPLLSPRSLPLNS